MRFCRASIGGVSQSRLVDHRIGAKVSDLGPDAVIARPRGAAAWGRRTCPVARGGHRARGRSSDESNRAGSTLFTAGCTPWATAWSHSEGGGWPRPSRPAACSAIAPPAPCGASARGTAGSTSRPVGQDANAARTPPSPSRSRPRRDHHPRRHPRHHPRPHPARPRRRPAETPATAGHQRGRAPAPRRPAAKQAPDEARHRQPPHARTTDPHPKRPRGPLHHLPQ